DTAFGIEDEGGLWAVVELQPRRDDVDVLLHLPDAHERRAHRNRHRNQESGYEPAAKRRIRRGGHGINSLPVVNSKADAGRPANSRGVSCSIRAIACQRRATSGPARAWRVRLTT